MRKLVLLFVCVAVIQAGRALKCKRCKDSTCSTLEDEICGGGPTGAEPACLLLIYKGGDKTITDRKCVIKPKDRNFECVTPSSKDVIEKCTTCNKDFCNETNGSSRISVGVIGVLAAAAALTATNIF